MGKARNQKKTKKRSSSDREPVDYAAMVDSFVEDRHDPDGPPPVEDPDEPVAASNSDASDDDEGCSEEDNEVKEGLGGKSDPAEESAESESDSDGNDDVDDDNSDRGEEEDGENSDDDSSLSRQDPRGSQLSSSHDGNDEPCTFDLRNLLAMNMHQVDSHALYSGKTRPGPKIVTTPPDKDKMHTGTASSLSVNEEFLLRTATDGCRQLLAALWQLPTERSDVGPLVTLPFYEEIQIPRALPPPVPKPESKWEKFAREKGIPLNKNKRSQKVWDETDGEWKYRHGYKKANDDVQQKWPIMEVKEGEDPFEDPWHRQRQAKRAKVERNLENQLRNQERTGALPRGSTNQILKGRAKAREAGAAPGTGGNDRPQPPPGIPVDLSRTKVGDGDDAASPSKPSKRGKTSTVAALVAVQRSTASLGKFDKMREGEPERKKASVATLKKRKRESATPDKKALAAEAERGMKVLKSVVEGGGGVAKERAIKKGKLAKGETAYDYDYDDGLGASSFRKKKGRAGAGKMKKMTKKRAR